MNGEQHKFDPTPHLIKLRGKGGATDYLTVNWRLVWLRSEHPDAAIVTQLVRENETAALFRCEVSIPNGGSATGYGSETAKDFGDFIEKAETKSVGRALAMLGYGTQFAGLDLAEGDRLADAPVDRKPPPSSHEPPDAPGRTNPPQRAPLPAPAAQTPEELRELVEAHIKRASSLDRLTEIMAGAEKAKGDGRLTVRGYEALTIDRDKRKRELRALAAVTQAARDTVAIDEEPF